jgi:hypothetical protein
MNFKKELKFRRAMEEVDGYYDDDTECDPFENI